MEGTRRGRGAALGGRSGGGTTQNAGSRKRRDMLRLLTGSLSTMLLITAAIQASEARLDEVQRRGRQVMPFDPEQTRHVFKKTDQSSVQEVVAKESSDTEQIELIPAHLSEISRKLAIGDSSDPARIHGDKIPGLAELRNAKPGQIKVEYEQLTDGARIRYTTDDPRLIKAIHQWFDAQSRDHARHAVPSDAHIQLTLIQESPDPTRRSQAGKFLECGASVCQRRERTLDFGQDQAARVKAN